MLFEFKTKYFAYFCFFIALITTLIFLFGLLSQKHLMISDQFERTRIIKEIIENKSFPEYNEIYGFKLKNTYAPLFDLLSALLAMLTALPLLFIWKLLAIIVFALFFWLSFIIARKHLSTEIAILTATIVVLLPWLFKRILNLIPETFGLLFFLAGIYFLNEKKFKVLMIIMPVLALMHYRSFLSFLAIFILYSIYMIQEKKILLKDFILPIASSITLPMLWFLPRLNELLSINAVNNPWLSSNILSAFSIVLIFGIIGFILALRKKEHNIHSFVFIFFFITWILFSFNNILSLREAIYLFFPIAFFSTFFIQEIKKKNELFAFSVCIILFLLLFFNASNTIFEPSYFTEERIKAIEKLKEFKGKIVFADFIGSYVIPERTGKAIVAGPFLEQLTNGNERALDSFNAFKNCALSDELIRKYKVDLIYLNHIWFNAFGCKPLDEKRFELLWENNDNFIYKPRV